MTGSKYLAGNRVTGQIFRLGIWNLEYIHSRDTRLEVGLKENKKTHFPINQSLLIRCHYSIFIPVEALPFIKMYSEIHLESIILVALLQPLQLIKKYMPHQHVSKGLLTMCHTYD